MNRSLSARHGWLYWWMMVVIVTVAGGMAWAQGDAGGGAERPVSYNQLTGQETVGELSSIALPEEASVPGDPGVADIAPQDELPKPGSEKSFSSLAFMSSYAAYPWSPNCKIFSTFPGSTTPSEGSGTLIDSKHVLTCGHCINKGAGGAWATSVRVVPAYYNTTGPFGEASSVNLHSWSGWTTSGDYNHDLGVIDLNRPVGALSGWDGCVGTSVCSNLLTPLFYHADYPHGSPYTGKYMYYRYGHFDTCLGYQVQYNTPPYTGEGGSGAFISTSAGPYVYAVLSNGTSAVTRDVIISPDKYSYIQNSILLAAMPATFDLIPLRVRVSPATASPGQPLSGLSYVVHNYSKASYSSAVTVDVYLSTNSYISTGDTKLQTHYFTRSFASRSSFVISPSPVPTVPPGTAPGNYWIGVILRVTDANAGNNAVIGWDADPIQIVAPPTATVHPTGTVAATATATASPTPTETDTVTPTPTATMVQRFIVDNTDAGFSVVGSWGTGSSAADRYGADYRYHAAEPGSLDYARWATTLPQAGLWQVSVWYSQGSNRTTSATYEVNFTGGTQSWVLNQQTNGGMWNSLGNYYLEPGDARVNVLANAAGGMVMADAVRWNYLGSEREFIVDNTDPGFSSSGVWTTGTGAGKFGSDYLYAAAGTGTKSATWELDTTLCGLYAVDVWYSANANRAPNVRYTITDGQQVRESAPVDQRLHGSTWLPVQTLYLPNSSHVMVTVTDAASSGYVIVDAVRLRYLSTPDWSAVVDNNAAAGVYVGGSWTTGTSAADKYGPNYFYTTSGTGAKSVLYRPTLSMPGWYQVAVWYPAGTNRAPDAAYTVGSAVGQDLVLIDQRNRGGQWVVLGHYFLPAGTQAFVKLSDDATSGYVMADAVRFVYVGAPPEDWIIDDGDPGFSFSGSWGTSVSAAMYRHSGRFHAANAAGDWAEWTVPVVKHYLCSIYYAPASNRAVDTPFQVTQIGPNLDVLVNQKIGFMRWIALNPAQLSYPVTSVKVYDTATSHTGYVIADAARFTLVQPE